jgi:predicted glutamine amidotransferase
MSLFGMVATENWEDDRFSHLTRAGTALVAHVTRQNDGTLQLVRAPLRRGPWTFAHDGAIGDLARLRPRVSQRRALDFLETTDRETLLGFLLSSIDSADAVDAGLVRAVEEIRNAGARGTFTFLMTNGTTLYAFRGGAPLVIRIRAEAVIVASQPSASDDAWIALSDGALVRIDRGTPIGLRWLVSSTVDASGPELPFTD